MANDRDRVSSIIHNGKVYLDADDLMTSLDWMREGLERQNGWRHRSAINKIFGRLIDNIHDIKIETLADELHKAQAQRPHLSDPDDISPGGLGPNGGPDDGIDWDARERGFR